MNTWEWEWEWELSSGNGREWEYRLCSRTPLVYTARHASPYTLRAPGIWPTMISDPATGSLASRGHILLDLPDIYLQVEKSVGEWTVDDVVHFLQQKGYGEHQQVEFMLVRMSGPVQYQLCIVIWGHSIITSRWRGGEGVRQV